MNEQEILQMYDSGISTHEIAKQFDTYPNRINRIIKKNGRALRTRSEAQKMVLQTGKAVHPTKGKCRTDEDKLKISEGQSNVWKKMSKKERNRRSRISKQQWERMTEEEKDNLQKAALAAMRKASTEGSKIEKVLLDRLTDEGYNVLFHAKKIVEGTDLEVDMFLPEINTVIEIDGPTHFIPIWGEEKLQRHVESDAKKSGIILSQGFTMIRIKYMIKNLSLVQERDFCNKVLEVIEDIKEERNKTKLIELEV